MTTINSSLKGMAITLTLVIGAATAFTQMGKLADAGKETLPSKPLIEKASPAGTYTVLEAAAVNAGLHNRLIHRGRVTMFAPTDAAFEKLPAGTVPALMQRQNLKTLERLLAFHIVPGVIDRAALKSLITGQGGEAVLKTIEGGTITAKLDKQGRLILRDEQGNVARVSAAEVYQSNGVVHGIDSVLMPAPQVKGGSS